MGLDDRDYMRGDAAQPGRRSSGGFGPIEWQIEECPEGELSMTETALAGAAGWGVGLLFGFSPMGRMLSLAAGAIGARWLSSHHVDVRCRVCDVNHDRPRRPDDRNGDDEPAPQRPL